MKAEFLKERYYKGKKRKIGEIVNMSLYDFNAYKQFKAVKLYQHKKVVKEDESIFSIDSSDELKINLDEFSYKDLQEMAKDNNINANQKKNILIEELKKKGL